MLAVLETPEVTFAERLKDLRRKAGLTQEQLAQKSGVTSSAVKKLEQGGVLNPKLDTLRALAGALDVTLDQLQEDDSGGEVAPAPPKKRTPRGRPRKPD